MGAFDDARIIVLFAATVRHALDGKFTVSAACICGHEGPIDPTPLATRYGEHTRWTWLENRMRCTACRGRGPSWITLKRYFPDGKPYVSEREEAFARFQARGQTSEP